MIAIERWRPFGSVARWDSEVNRLFDGFFGRPAASNGERMWVPALDMYETKDEIVLNFELPGVAAILHHRACPIPCAGVKALAWSRDGPPVRWSRFGRLDLARRPKRSE